ncbi:hypothetical protein HU200_055639 [Digitaria exilis]|uniref:KIB1-4 beta-propeller domain-containing protein n=1 Tax=Digitaria exilis TaxID=1010633 RepID=A0A835E4F4_9POAL|nr:hypothetical protein HU200_055639 [Digitaria exilis]
MSSPAQRPPTPAASAWRAAAGTRLRGPSSSLRPWFLMRSAADGRYYFLRPTGDHHDIRPVVVPPEVTSSEGEAILCALRGWLPVNDGGRLFLRDPISLAEVPLPPAIPSMDDQDPAAAYELSEIFLSDDPLDAPDRRCMAFAFFKAGGDGDGRRILASCVPGVDAEWARFQLDEGDGGGQQHVVGSYWGTLEFFRVQAYVLLGSSNCTLAVCDVHTRRGVSWGSAGGACGTTPSGAWWSAVETSWPR